MKSARSRPRWHSSRASKCRRKSYATRTSRNTSSDASTRSAMPAMARTWWRSGWPPRPPAGDVAQTINMLFGNSSLHDHVELVDADFPPEFLGALPRSALRHRRSARAARCAATRPLTCAALKPQGLSPERLAALCHTLALAGVDIIKDDHGLADQSYAPFRARVAACQRAIERAQHETGRRTLYAPSLVGIARLRWRRRRAWRAPKAQLWCWSRRRWWACPLLPSSSPANSTCRCSRIRRTPAPRAWHRRSCSASGSACSVPTQSSFRISAVALRGANANARPSRTVRAAPWAHLRTTLPVPGGGMSVERSREVVAMLRHRCDAAYRRFAARGRRSTAGANAAPSSPPCMPALSTPASAGAELVARN